MASALHIQTAWAGDFTLVASIHNVLLFIALGRYHVRCDKPSSRKVALP
jgi:hypothetical protein